MAEHPWHLLLVGKFVDLVNGKWLSNQARRSKQITVWPVLPRITPLLLRLIGISLHPIRVFGRSLQPTLILQILGVR